MANDTTATGNTPTGNPGAGTRETSSAPDTAPRAVQPNVAGANATGVTPPISDTTLGPEDFKKDGNLRKDAVRRIEENAPPRGGERSYNEVTDETTVTTTVGGRSVTFVEEGDTRGEPRRSGMDSLARASENAEESK